MERGVWWATAHRVAKKLDMTEATEHVCIHTPSTVLVSLISSPLALSSNGLALCISGAMETIWHVLLLHLLPQSLCPPSPILEKEVSLFPRLTPGPRR